jgi:CoA-transferase family III
MALTGFPSGVPLASPAASFAVLRQVLDELATVTRIAGGLAGRELCADPAELIAGRAALMGLTRRGQVSAGGSTRLLRTTNGWCAVTLSRDADVVAIPAVLGVLGLGAADAVRTGPRLDEWAALAWAGGQRPAAEISGAAQLLGIPAGLLPGSPPSAPNWPPWKSTRIAGRAPAGLPLAGAVVADLSSMWAGPLCARLLGLAGARVIKVESADRLDGARAGNQAFYDWLHAGHASVVLPFREGRLTRLLSAADVVIEASRPRALAQLGLAPGMIPHKDGQVWLSITGYGRVTEGVAFGDDAAVAGGLVGWTDSGWTDSGWTDGGWTGADWPDGGEPVFCADAIADPLTGVTGALAVARSLAGGGGELIDLPMRTVAACFGSATAPDHGPHEVALDGSSVTCAALERSQAVLPPRAPVVSGTAASPGADTEAVLAWLESAQRGGHPLERR